MKLCTECKHYKIYKFRGWCNRIPSPTAISIIDGKEYADINLRTPHIERSSDGQCGVEGKYWEKKKGIVARIFRRNK